MTIKVYLLRCEGSDLAQILSTVNVVHRAKSPTPELAPVGSRNARLMVRTGTIRIRVVVDGPVPTDTPGCTWTQVGVQYAGNPTTYTPPDRCSRRHPPLRYLSNGGCVYCAKQKTEGPSGSLTVQVPSDQEFDGIVKSMGWEVEQRRLKRDRWILVLDLGETGYTDGLLTARAMGWEVIL